MRLIQVYQFKMTCYSILIKYQIYFINHLILVHAFSVHFKLYDTRYNPFESYSPTCDEKTDDKYYDVAGQGAMERLGNAMKKMRLMISNPLLTLNFVLFKMKYTKGQTK